MSLAGAFSVGCSVPVVAPDITGTAPVETVLALAPGATLSPAALPAEAPVPEGLRVVLVSSGDEGAAVAAAATTWAEVNSTEVQQISSTDDTMDDDLREAVESEPDLVIAAGPHLIDLVGYRSPQYLTQQFLVVGGQLAEPTNNVTAVIWPGGSARGGSIDPTAGLDVATFTGDRVVAALDAGVRVFLDGSDGYVVDLS